MALRTVKKTATKTPAKASKVTPKVARTPRSTKVDKTAKNVEAEVAALLGELNSRQQTALGKFLATVVAKTHKDDMSDIEPKTTSGRRGRTAKAKTEDDEPAKPRRGRPAKTGVELDDVTVDGILAWLDELEVEPVAGGIRELKPQVESWGADFAMMTEGLETRAEKTETAGMFLAQMELARKTLSKVSDEDIEAIMEELGLEPAARKGSNVKSILVAINELAAGGDDEDEEDEEDEDEEDEDEEDEDEEEEEEEEEEDEESDEELDDIDEDEEEGDDPDLDDLEEETTSKKKRR